MNVLKKRNFNYSSVSTLLITALLAVIIVANAFLSLLGRRFSLYVDLTDNSLWTLSDEAKEIIAMAEGDVTITFCHEQDYVDSNGFLPYIRQTAQEIAKAFPNIKVRYINSQLEPQLVKNYKLNGVDKIAQSSIIVEKGDATVRPPDEMPSEFRVYAPAAFYINDPTTSQIWGYNGEEIFAAAILAVTADEHPTAYFTIGHGETTEAAFVNTIIKAGYEVSTIDLSKEEIPKDCRLLIVNDPKYDFAGYNMYDKDAVSEISKIDRFLEMQEGTLMVFKSPEVPKLKNLEEYLYEWGVVFGEGTVVDLSNSITADGKALVADYPSGTLASSIHSDISSLAVPPKTVLKNAGAIYVSDLYTAGRDEEEGNATNTYLYSGNNAYRELSAVLTAHQTAQITQDGETVDRLGGYNLMTITRDVDTRDNDTYSSYVMAAQTTYFTSPDYLESNVYANENILYYALRVMGQEKVPCNIEFKEFANTKIQNMTIAEATRATVLMVTVLPILTVICGIVVTMRRKYK